MPAKNDNAVYQVYRVIVLREQALLLQANADDAVYQMHRVIVLRGQASLLQKRKHRPTDWLYMKEGFNKQRQRGGPCQPFRY
ncbi:hypothetical protein FQ192_10935 [Pseudomonas sp. ANT_J12]|nr:hypothetical protein FQ192_10935 [Pseudomonas sp. ANT_J12]